MSTAAAVANVSNSSDTSALRSKASRLRSLLDATADSSEATRAQAVEAATQRLRDRLTEFFTSAMTQLERRRTVLLSTIDKRAAAATGVALSSERSLIAEAEAATTSSDDELRRRLDAAIGVRLLMRDGDAAIVALDDAVQFNEAERLMGRLLKSLRLEGSGWPEEDGDNSGRGEDAEWARMRQNDNPFAGDSTTAEKEVAAAAAKAKVSDASAYGQVSSELAIGLSKFLSPVSDNNQAANRNPASNGANENTSVTVSKSAPQRQLVDASPTGLPNIMPQILGGNASYPQSVAVVPSPSSVRQETAMSLGATSLVTSPTSSRYPAFSLGALSHFPPGSNRPSNHQNRYYVPPEVDAYESSSSNSGDAVNVINDFRTVGAPKSLAYLNGTFYTSEGGCIRRYSENDGQRLGKFEVSDDSGNPVTFYPICVRSCSIKDWIIILDSDKCRVLCVREDGTIGWNIDSRISAKYKLEEPTQAVSNGDCLFICSPPVGIFIARVSDGRRTTQTNSYLRLSRPIRLAWCDSISLLLVLDDPGDTLPYRVFSFEVTGDGTGLAMACKYYVEVDSSHEPDLVCPPDSNQVYVTVDGDFVMQFSTDSFDDQQSHSLVPISDDASGHKQDICAINQGLVAVCDKKFRWVRLIDID